jgi:predicted amidohydrolase YtcJ
VIDFHGHLSFGGNIASQLLKRKTPRWKEWLQRISDRKTEARKKLNRA